MMMNEDLTSGDNELTKSINLQTTSALSTLSSNGQLTTNEDVYEQFDQLSNRNSASNNRTKPMTANSQRKKMASQRRDRIKSFIEFDDDLDDDLNDNSFDYQQRSSLSSSDHRRFSTTTDSYLQSEEFINIFQQQTKLSTNNNDNNNTADEWSDFQMSSTTPVNDKSILNQSINDDHHSTNITMHINDQQHNQCLTSAKNDDNIPVVNDNIDDRLNDEDVSEDEPEEESEDGVSDTESNMLYGRLNKMQQEQELLNNSLVALTSHFAQVQLRLRQIVELSKDVDVEKRETLLAELETFANRGIPELMLASNVNQSPLMMINNLERSVSMATSLMADDVFEDDNDDDGGHNHQDGIHHQTSADDQSLSGVVGDVHSEMDWRAHNNNNNNTASNQRINSANSVGRTGRTSWRSSYGDCDSSHQPHRSTTSTILVTEEKLERQRSRQKELITQLKDQLEDLERYAYETGELNSLPSSMLLERQNAIIEQLRSKLPVLSIDEIDQLTPDELRKKVDHAVKELVNPAIMKEQLVSQLKTQVTDLERFIEFLQKDGAKLKKYKQQFLMNNNNNNNGSRLNFIKFLQKKSRDEITSNKQKMTNGQLMVDDGNRPQQQQPITRQEQTNTSNNIHQKCPKTNNRTNTNNLKTSSTTNNTARQDEAQNIFKRILSLLHVFAWTQLGTCASFAYTDHRGGRFEQNTLKRTQTSCGRHWGDLRAHLELAITELLDFYKQQNMIRNSHHQHHHNHNSVIQDSGSGKTSTETERVIKEEEEEQEDEQEVKGDDETNDRATCATTNDDDFISLGHTALVIDNYFLYEQITIMVRKRLAIALRNLIQHGLIGCLDRWPMPPAGSSSTSTAISTTTTAPNNTVGHLLSIGLFGCFSTGRMVNFGTGVGSGANRRPMHAWELIVYYYEIKNGGKYRSTPTRRLSQSFGLQVVSGVQSNPKHSLLAAIDDIIDSHTRHKRSLDSHFKAFVSVALNQQMLSQWLRLILRNPTIVQECYEKWSYTASTGFDDALRQLDKLSALRFCLPTDIAVRQLQSIHDAF